MGPILPLRLPHAPMQKPNEAEYLGYRFWREMPAVDAPVRFHVVSACAFLSPAGYKDSAKYARGLAHLARAVQVHLPDFLLRVYCDRSLELPVLRELLARDALDSGRGPLPADKAQEVVTAWEGCFDQLAKSRCAEVVWFEHPQFLDPVGRGHKGMFATSVRFLPLFATPLPSWCGAPEGQGAIVFVADIDYHDYVREHIPLHIARWLADARGPAPAAGGSNAPPLLAAAVPELVSVSNGTPLLGSALRHTPTCGLPAIIANCIMATRRFPKEWFADYFADLRGATSHLQGRFSRSLLADPRSAERGSFVRLKQGEFPYGCDEFMLTHALKARAGARAEAGHWLFFIIPDINMLVRDALRLMRAGAASALGGGGDGMGAGSSASSSSGAGARAIDAPMHPALRRIGDAAAACAGVPQPPPLAPLDAFGGGSERGGEPWEELATKRVGLPYSRYRGGAPAALSAHAGELRALCAASLDALLAGAAPHTAEEVDYFASSMGYATALAPRAAGALSFAVGGGQWAPLGSEGVQARALMAFLTEGLRSQAHCAPRIAPAVRSGAGEGGACGAAGSGGSAAAGSQGGKRGREDEIAGADSTESMLASRPPAMRPAHEAMPNSRMGGGQESLSGSAPAVQLLHQPSNFPGWELRQSRSTQKWYYTQGEESVWFDPELPRAWAWGRVGGKDSAPKYYVNLETGERMENKPE